MEMENTGTFACYPRMNWDEFVTKLLRGSYDLTMLYYIEGSNGEFYGTMEEFHFKSFLFFYFFPKLFGI